MLCCKDAACQRRAEKSVGTFRDFLLLLLVLVGERRLLQRAADALLVGPVAATANVTLCRIDTPSAGSSLLSARGPPA